MNKLNNSDTLIERMLVPIDNTFVEFVSRSENQADPTITDKIVIREMFIENVYHVGENYFDDTGIVVDIGANIGAFMLFAAAKGAKKVYGFEPEAENREALQLNIEANKGKFETEFIICPSAISNENGEATIEAMQGASTITKLKNFNKDVKPYNTQIVRTITLEQALVENNITYADFLKIDCEGAEYQIIKAASLDVLKKFKRIAMEYHTTDTDTFGRMVAKLSLVFNLNLFGNYKEIGLGGQLYGERY